MLPPVFKLFTLKHSQFVFDLKQLELYILLLYESTETSQSYIKDDNVVTNDGKLISYSLQKSANLLCFINYHRL